MEERVMIVKVGKPAPELEAEAFVKGDFKKVGLADYKDQWAVLMFYPADFTFV